MYTVDGLIGDAGRIAGQAVRDGWFSAATLREPYRIEGKKTMGLEIAEQFGWRVPDVVVYPTGGGVGLIGIRKALDELTALGWITGRLPGSWPCSPPAAHRLCGPSSRGRDRRTVAGDEARTVAFGINVAAALGDFLILSALRDSKGTAIAVDDQDILGSRWPARPMTAC